MPRVDIPPKVTGEYFYIQDVRVPGMLHGRVIRPTGLGSQLLSYGKPSHGARVVRLKNFLGVVAEREWDAIQAAQELEVKWSDWAGLPTMDKLYTYIRETPASRTPWSRRPAMPHKALAAAPRPFDATYTTAVQTHGSIGPSCAVADVKDATPRRSGRERKGPTSCARRSPTRSTCPLENVRIITYEASGMLRPERG